MGLDVGMLPFRRWVLSSQMFPLVLLKAISSLRDSQESMKDSCSKDDE